MPKQWYEIKAKSADVAEVWIYEEIGEDFWTGAGLLLVLFAGYMPEATYDHVLLLLGLAFVSGVASWAAGGPVGEARPAAQLSDRP